MKLDKTDKFNSKWWSDERNPPRLGTQQKHKKIYIYFSKMVLFLN